MQTLVEGVHHFRQNVFPSKLRLFKRLAKGQQPIALFITCSDSRINPNLITQTEPGELFILRNAGNIVPTYGAAAGGEGATIEYAVAGLDVEDVIVCGHSHCGAIKGLLEPDAIKDLPAVAAWLSHAEATRRIVREKYGCCSNNVQVTRATEENVLLQLENLRTHPSVAAAVARGRLKLHGWVYKIETGEVSAYDPKYRQFRPVTTTAPSPTPPGARASLAPAV
jgi:carbonic anhydrase